jgi:hypothetical protein
MHGVLQRFKVTGEMSPPPDFTDKNKAWFDMKLLVPITTWRSTPDNVMDSKGYAELIRKICRELELPTTHFLHIGRVVGPTVLELEEIRGDDIRQLGNWDLCVQETTYSAKLPLKAIKPAAGFPTEKGLHWSPREMLSPHSLCRRKSSSSLKRAARRSKTPYCRMGNHVTLQLLWSCGMGEFWKVVIVSFALSSREIERRYYSRSFRSVTLCRTPYYSKNSQPESRCRFLTMNESFGSVCRLVR